MRIEIRDLPLVVSDLTRRRREVVLPANMGPMMTWTSPAAWREDTELDLSELKVAEGLNVEEEEDAIGIWSML